MERREQMENKGYFNKACHVECALKAVIWTGQS